MPIWAYWHRLEYRWVNGAGVPVHRHTEVVEDAGWAMRPTRRVTADAWFLYYTRLCAEDFLSRIEATEGIWIVTVYRLGTDRDGHGDLRGAIKISWPPATPLRNPAAEVAATFDWDLSRFR